MRHLGDITQINGTEIEPVWVITGGSPCQDLSIAGKRKGLAGERSGLFMEQIRVVKEMRERERRDGRTGEFIRPRYMVWENVPGALSSNGGKDFAAVLEEIIKIAEPEAPHIQVPEHGWSTWGGYRDVGGRWSVAYRIHDAQWYGVPQRRRRISVVADFGGSTAHEILFEPCGMSGNPTESGTSRERPAGAIETGAYPAVARSLTARYDGSPCVDRGPNIICEPLNQSCLTAWDCQSKRIFDTNGVSPTLQGGVGGGVNNPALFCANPWDSQSARLYDANGIYSSLNANSGGGQNRAAVFYMATQQGGVEIREADKAPTLTAAAEMSGNNQPTVYCLQGNGIDRADTAGCNGKGWREDVSYTLNTVDRPAVCAGLKLGNSEKSRSIGWEEEIRPTLNAESGGIAILDIGHRQGAVRECGQLVPTLTARAGTGGGNVPLCYAYGIGNGQANEASSTVKEVCQTLNTMHDAQAVLAENEEYASVRRLTPLECTRLQGFPDGWVDIGEWTDEKGRVHKEADAPKYKALGNSIALPFWRWLLNRISEYLLADATLGSLFDGIGGFPLCWAEIHGAEACRWSSEIEQFPIAVVKRHFGDEDAGIAGDVDKFLRGEVGH